jgi:hypothetical protein
MFMNSTNDQIKHPTATDGKPPVRGQLPPLQLTDKEYKRLIKALYPKDRSKKFMR